MLHPGLRDSARIMRHELEQTRLVVALAPCQRGRQHQKIRVAEERNPEWYRRLCAAYPSQRSKPRQRKKSDTCIKRAGALRALREMENGRCETEYAQRLLEFVFEHYAAHLALANETTVTKLPKQSVATSPIYL